MCTALFCYSRQIAPINISPRRNRRERGFFLWPRKCDFQEISYLYFLYINKSAKYFEQK